MTNKASAASAQSQLIPAPTDPILATDGSQAVNAIVGALAHQQITLPEATTCLEALAGGLDAMRKRKTGAPAQSALPIPGFRRKSIRWCPDEDERLIGAVSAHGTENWPLVASIVGGGRTRSQCAQRWGRGVNPKISKSNWCKEEEQALINAVEAHGSKAWTRIAADLGDRSDVQCRFRFRFLSKKAKEAGVPLQPISPPRAQVVMAHDGEALLIQGEAN
jgi:hypothetical protein